MNKGENIFDKKQDYLKGNLEDWSAARPDLAKALDEAVISGDLETFYTTGGLPVLLKNGISLHSRLDPEKEADDFLKTDGVQRVLNDGSIPLVFGFGAGYHIRALLKIFPEAAVYEPDLSVLKAAFSFMDWRGYSTRIRIFTELHQLPDHTSEKIALLVHRPSERLMPHECGKLKTLLDDPGGGPGSMPGERLKIMVVTPLNGGSLPVAYHATRALKNLGHEVVEADMSGMGDYYDRFRKADAPADRRDAVGVKLLSFCGEYISFLAEIEKPHLLLALAQAPLDSRFLHKIRSMGIPSAFWFVEDYRFLGYFRDLALSYDFFFHIQGERMERELSGLGVRRYHYLPLAADIDVFKPVSDLKLIDPYRAELSFMGSGYPNRRLVFNNLLDYDLKIWGTEWDLSSELGKRVQDNGRRIPTEETALVFNAAKVNLNLHSSVFSNSIDREGNFLNPRTFEIAACGAFQLVDNRHPLSRHFEPGIEAAVFEDEQDLRSKIDFYLERPHLRKEIAEKGRARVIREHTYEHRMRELVDVIRKG